MDLYEKYKSPLGYEIGDDGVDSYGVNHRGFSTRDELEYQVARQQREQQLIQNYNSQGITQDYPQYGTNFWGDNTDNNYGFGSSNIGGNIQNVTNQLNNQGMSYNNQYSGQTPTPWSVSAIPKYTTSTLMNSQSGHTTSVPWHDNYLTEAQRIQAFKNGDNLRLHIDENPQENGDWKWWCNLEQGRIAVNKYNDVVDKYANQYSIDPDLVKAIMFAENACGYYYGANKLADYLGLSKSQLPMNIRGNIWSDFQGKHYDTNVPEQNIELGIKLIKQIYDSIEYPTPEKVTTIWNSAAKDKISSFGYRGGTAYRTKPWLNNNGK